MLYINLKHQSIYTHQIILCQMCNGDIYLSSTNITWLIIKKKLILTWTSVGLEHKIIPCHRFITMVLVERSVGNLLSVIQIYVWISTLACRELVLVMSLCLTWNTVISPACCEWKLRHQLVPVMNWCYLLAYAPACCAHKLLIPDVQTPIYV